MKNNIVIISLITIALLIGVSCHSGKNNNDKSLSTDLVKNPNSANGDIDSTKLPVFKFDEETHDFGKVIEGEKVAYAFKFKNVGKTDLIITDAKASCGCTVADYPKNPISPGGSGIIEVKFNSEGKKDFQNKSVTVVANTQPNTKVLHIKAMVVNPQSDKENNNN